jgi:hypothetical protein
VSSWVHLAPSESVSEAEARRQNRGFSGGSQIAKRKQGWPGDLSVEGTSDSEAFDVGASNVARVLGRWAWKVAVTLRTEAGGDRGCQWPRHSARVKLKTLRMGFDAPKWGQPRGVDEGQGHCWCSDAKIATPLGVGEPSGSTVLRQPGGIERCHSWHGTVLLGGFRARRAKASRPRIEG